MWRLNLTEFTTLQVGFLFVGSVSSAVDTNRYRVVAQFVCKWPILTAGLTTLEQHLTRLPNYY